MTDPHPGEPVSEHPVSEELAAYLSGGATPADRAALEEHLTTCRQCRREVVSARRLLSEHRSPRRLVWLVPAAAAAVLVTVLLVRPPGLAHWEPLRSDSGAAGSGSAPSIAVVAPVDGDTVGTGPVIFVWRAQAGRPLYRLALTDNGGRALWTGETGDTTLTLPASVSLDRGRTHYWIVDALGADGRSLTTRNHRFITPP